MAKRSKRRFIRYEKDQAGCISGLISIFDFRRGRSTRKLLSDRRRGNRLSDGTGYSRSQLLMANSDEKCQSNYNGVEKETARADAGKTSVKELMEVEMVGEQETRKHVDGADLELREPDSEGGARPEKSRKRRSKSNKSFSDFDVSVSRRFELDNSRDQASETSNNLDLEVIIEELCHQIHQKNTSSEKHDCPDHLDMQSNRKYIASEEKLIDALEVFLNQKFTNGKNVEEDGKIHHTEEFVNALQTLSSNRELFLKLLRDPNSVLMKYIQDLGDGQLEKDQIPKSVSRSNLDEEQSYSTPSELVNRKHHNFFRKKSKSKEKNAVKGIEDSRPTSRIVVLKPGPAVLRNSDTESNVSSSQRFRNSAKEGPSERVASQFSFTEIKRKLKHAMRMEQQQRVPSDGTNRRHLFERQLSGNSLDNSGWRSPNRNHFYIEKFATPSNATKRRDGVGPPKDTDTSMGKGTVRYSEPRLSNLYIEAKKHLSEMLSNGDEIDKIAGRELPKSLGRILSLPEYNFTPICSPGKGKEQDLITAQTRLSPRAVHGIDQSVCHETKNSPSQPCLTDDKPDEELEAPDSGACVVDDLDHASAESSSSNSETTTESHVEITETSGTLLQEEREALEVSAEQSWSSITVDGGFGDAAESCDADKSSDGLKLDSLEEDQSTSSPLRPPSGSSIIKTVDDTDGTHERTAHASPVSVLEPLFTEDDISPASIKFQSGEKLSHLQPIHSDELFSSAGDDGISLRISMENEESIFEYVEAVLLGSGLNWDEFLVRWFSSEELLEPSLFNEVELFSSRSCHEQKLLFDCTNKVLKEVCERYFLYSPLVSIVTQNVRPVPRGKDLISEVWKGVEWHLLQPPPLNLDQVLRKDMAKNGAWMDLRFDAGVIGFQIGDAIFEELVEDIILNFTNEGPESDFDVLPEALSIS